MLDEKKCPTYLVSDKESAIFDEFALTDLNTLKDMIKELCTELKHPIAVFDFIRLKNEEVSEYSKKIESDINFFSLRNGCKLLRQCAGNRFCEECDKFHAKCLANDADTIRENIAAQLDKRPNYFYDGYVDRPPTVLEGYDRPILEYHCPMMGYRELIFPIRHKGRVFGVLFVGQISIQSKEDGARDSSTIDSIRREFFHKNNPNELFSEFVQCFNSEPQSSRLSSDELEKWIMESDQNPDKYDKVLNFNAAQDQTRYHFKTYASEVEYHSYLKKICASINKMEQKLEQNYKDRRSAYFDQVIKGITKQFDDRHTAVRRVYKGSNRYEQLTAELKEMWEALDQITIDIRKAFPHFVRSVTVYGDGVSLTVGNTNVKKAQLSYPTSPSSNMKNTVYDFTDIRVLGTNDYVDSVNVRSGEEDSEDVPSGVKLLDGLSNGVPREDCVLVACRSIAVFLRVRDLQTHLEIYQALAKAIGNGLCKINSDVSLCRANLQREKHVLTIRMYRHETAHISERLSNLTDRYLSGNGSLLFTLSDEKRWLVVNDIQNTISLLSDMADNVGLVTGAINENSPMLSEQEELDVFDMLYKWRSMYRYQLVDRSLNILVPRSSGAGDSETQRLSRVNDDVATALNSGVPFVEGKRRLKINTRLFELLVYNLVDNAAKYAYRGTNIYLIWSKSGGAHELRVISYGPEMESGQDHYALYARGSGTLIQNVQGEGIGLYAVKRICELLGLTIDDDSELIAPNYLPFVRWYQKANFSGDLGYQKIPDSMLPIDPALERIVVNQYKETKLKGVTRERLRKRIEMPTYRTTFRIQIKT